MKRPVAAGLVFAIWCCAPALVALAGEPIAGSAEARVRAAAMRVYVHGMTAAIADQEVGHDGIGELLRLVDDPSHPRRDNVVAFLAYLGSAETTQALVGMLNRPRPAAASVEDERALLLVPHALGRIAARGDDGALNALLAITAPSAAQDAPLHAGIREAAIAGLALTGRPAARERLMAIADGRVVLDARRPELAERARVALEEILPSSAGDGAGIGAEAPAAVAVVDYTPDPAQQTHQHGLTFVNHVSLPSPMTPSRLDDVLREGTRRVATGDFEGDVPCCVAVSRSGVGGTFGSAGDGLDIVDTNPGITMVLGQSAARVKVVSVINWCSGPGMNIIGCSYTPGSSVALVRLSSIAYESVLWIHEYGHNLGLGHSGDSDAIMYGSDNGANNGLALAGCSVFHAPAPSANASMTVAGTCNDDGDALADPIDNCPLVPNESQLDTDGNGVGDVCEDGVILGDMDLSGRVDGFDLARLGRAFGAGVGDPGYDAVADLNSDGEVDGDDLSLLASEFGK